MEEVGTDTQSQTEAVLAFNPTLRRGHDDTKQRSSPGLKKQPRGDGTNYNNSSSGKTAIQQHRQHFALRPL